MSIFSITDVTSASAFLNPMDAIRKSDRRAARRRRMSIAEFSALDDRTLKDIGVSRSEIRELADAQLRFEAEAVAAQGAARRNSEIP